ncbi:MAG: RNA polymerase sigma factor [Bacteroidaceae bacterium]|nr:RNA polymerase sigma factor [Bacteroidaceae bacterium]
MDDKKIVDLYWSRSENAISETDKKYGKYCYSIAYNILTNNEEAEESVSDTYMAAWRSIPPRRPSNLAAFLGKITRNLAIDRWRSHNRRKRGGGEIVLALEELNDCIADNQTVEQVYERKRMALVFNQYLETLPETERQIFLCRYWFLDSISDIANYFGYSTSKVTSMLHRSRKKLRLVLEKEEIL